MQKTLKSLCIVGGGTAGWMAATLLSSSLRGSNIKITVVESPDIDTIGVGESTVPSIMSFIKTCQIDLKEFIQATSATFKLGIRFDHWSTTSQHYFHPFGRVGQDIGGFEFYQVWLKSLNDGQATRWADHSPSAIMAEHERFMLRPVHSQDWVLSNYAHALHLDAVKMARYLRDLCIQRGVTRIESTVQEVIVDNKEYIQSLTLDNATTLNSDFFIDCTGFTGLLIDKTLNVGFDNWSHYLPCNRAVVVQTENVSNPVPYTVASAQAAGWSWKIPLQHRTGNGYVFANQFCSDDEAHDTLMNSINGKVLSEPRVIPFVTGKRKKIWHNNCLALGLAGGFLEPLESTAIHLVYKTLVHFIKNFPDSDFDADTEKNFNQQIDADYLEVRDFIILHYCTSTRNDTDFWRWCQTMPMPESLAEKLRLFRKNGHLDHTTGQFFTCDSWCSILEGMGIRPQKYHSLLDIYQSQRVTQTFGQHIAKTLTDNVDYIKATVLKMPNHYDYIKARCQANNQENN